MTPEEFLAAQTALAELAESMSTLYQVVRTVRLGFVEQAGMSEEAADVMTIEWSKAVMFRAISGLVAA